LDYEQRFDAALDDDFNTPIAISILFEISKQINLEKEKDIDFASALSGLLVRLGGYLGILQNNPEDFLKQGVQLSDEEIDQKIKDRNLARSEKDFALSDQIRNELEAHGIILEDSAEGTSWRRK
jgi:cysteinyl-tRNA synthetase